MTMITPQEMEMIDALAQRLFRAGVFPKTVLNADVAFAILLKGHELGIQPMAAAAGIAIVSGKVSLGADITVATCARRRDVCLYFSCVESTDKLARYTTHRAGAPAPVSLTYTFAQATRAGLTSSGTWRAHTEAMLRARCAAALARAVYPDLVAGCYDPDEIEEIQSHDTAPMVVAAPQLPAPAPKPTALDDYRAALSAAGCLFDAAQDYRLLSQRLHAEDATTAASEALAEWLDAGGYVMTATEQRAAERGDYPREMLDLLDAVAECASGADVVRWWGQTAHVVEALGAHAKAAKLIVARTYCARVGDTSKSPAKVFAGALAPKPPPTGTDSPSSARGDTATGDATPADATPSAEALASIARVGDVHAYLAAKSTYTEIERAVVAHGAHVPALEAAAVARLEALGEGGDEGNRTRLVAAWVSESASRAQRAERTAAKVQRAA
jgi:hypothetical protein